MEKDCSRRRHSNSFFAWFLILLGIIWLLKRNGWEFNLPWLSEFTTGGSLHSFFVPIVIIAIGLILIAGRRFFGALLLIAVVLLLVPHLVIPGLLLIFFLPVLLLVVGIIILSKLFF